MEPTQALSPLSRQPNRTSQAGADAGQYLTLRLGEEEYAIDILRVQEIRSYEEPTKMVNSPSFIKGVINLRGVIVPIVDLRLKLNISKVEYTEFTVVIILNVRAQRGEEAVRAECAEEPGDEETRDG